MRLQEVSRAHSTVRTKRCVDGKGRIRSIKKLHPQYVIGFIDGEGSFNVSIYHDETMKNKVFVRLTEKGVREIIRLREKIRILGKKHRSETARIRENRSSSGVR